MLAAALIAAIGTSLPPATRAPESAPGDGDVAGVVHVHSNRSDGRSAPDIIAASAAKAGLKFVVLTDHGDATRPPDPPAYVSGVLLIDAVEISTDHGHVVALKLPRAPYPLAGESRDVIEDVHRLGGFAVAAHPDSPKDDLRWTDWESPIDGVELLNLDSEWRFLAAGDWRSRLDLLRAALSYPVRPAPAIAALTRDHDTPLITRWAEASRTRRLAIFAGADAHARLDLVARGPGETPIALPLPSYEAVFRTMSTRVRPEEPLNGDAAHDAQQVLDALTQGHAHTVFDALLTPPAFAFQASAGAITVGEGDALTTDEEVTLTLRTNAPVAFKAVLYRNHERFQEASSGIEPSWRVPAEPAFYRVEIRATDRSPERLWLLSNPIYVNMTHNESYVSGLNDAGESQGSKPAGAAARALFDAKSSGTWTSEAAAESKTAVDVVTPQGVAARELLFRYGFPSGPVVGQYAAAVVNTSGGIEPYRALSFTARSEQPIRLSVQLRQEGSDGQGWRWQRTVYLDSNTTHHTLALEDFRPMGPTLTDRAPLEHVSSILLAVDQTNTKPGSSGRVWFSSVVLE